MCTGQFVYFVMKIMMGKRTVSSVSWRTLAIFPLLSAQEKDTSLSPKIQKQK